MAVQKFENVVGLRAYARRQGRSLHGNRTLGFAWMEILLNIDGQGIDHLLRPSDACGTQNEDGATVHQAKKAPEPTNS